MRSSKKPNNSSRENVTPRSSGGSLLDQELSKFNKNTDHIDDGLGNGDDLGELSFKENGMPALDDLESLLDGLDEEGEESKKEEIKSKSSSDKKKKESAVNKPSAGRIVFTVFFGIFWTGVLCLLIYGLYMNWIKYPPQMEVVEEHTGSYCLRNWQESVRNLEGVPEDSYLVQEESYANDNEYKKDFLKKVASTVTYTPPQQEALNIYGNTMINRNDEVVYTDATTEVGGTITVSYIDYEEVEIDRERVQELMESAELKRGDVDYSEKLVDVFCQYITGLEEEDIPIKDERRVANMILNEDGSYSITQEEDIYIDQVLFSSEELWDLMDRFSAVAGSLGEANPEWDAWNKLSEEEKEKTEEPSKELEELSPTEDWLAWDELSYSEKQETEEPDKYNWKDVMSKDWCGAYYLQNEYEYTDSHGNIIKGKVSAEVGEGTFDDPAGLNTPILTSIFVNKTDENGNPVTNEYPIKVSMIEYGVSQDAIDWFESKDERNRGIDIESEVQYGYYIFEVTNMSDKELVISDNSSLCDSNVNLMSRTGDMYGLQSLVTLKPDETGIIESWSRSTELNKRYVIWGADFARRTDPIWFRVLAGNIDDPSDNKGVYINNSREENTTWSGQNSQSNTDDSTDTEDN